MNTLLFSLPALRVFPLHISPIADLVLFGKSLAGSLPRGPAKCALGGLEDPLHIVCFQFTAPLQGRGKGTAMLQFGVSGQATSAFALPNIDEKRGCHNPQACKNQVNWMSQYLPQVLERAEESFITLVNSAS